MLTICNVDSRIQSVQGKFETKRKIYAKLLDWKCYMADTGLLVSHAFGENELAAKRVHDRLLLDDMDINEGMIVENVVAQMLHAAPHSPAS